MAPVQIELDQDVVAVLEGLRRPAKDAARDLIVIELYREGTLPAAGEPSSSRVSREEFIRYASAPGVPYFKLAGNELRREIADSDSL